MKKFIDHDSEGPNISLWAIEITMNTLGGHIQRRTYIKVSKSTPK